MNPPPGENSPLERREVLVAVTGGIAAYKTAALVSQLVQAGAGVSVAMTAAATKFIGPVTFSALTGRAVATDVFQPHDYPLGAHIELVESCELLCVAPATANFLAKAAGGMADDVVSTLYLSFAGPVLLAPAMNADMWEKPAVQRNVDQLRHDGAQIIHPEEGWLSCRRRGPGRMADPETIYHAVQNKLSAIRAGC